MQHILYYERSILKSFIIHLNVVYALILRETKTRFGHYQVGFLWAFLEPIIWIGTFGFLFYYSARHVPSNMDIFNFLLTGLLPFSLFKSTLNKVSVCLSANKSLLYYPQVKIIDLIIARAYLEIALTFFVFTVLLLVNHIFFEMVVIKDILNVITSLILVWLFSLSMGIVFLNLISIFQSADKILQALQRPLFWTSGLFFTAQELSGPIREFLLYNPVLHFIEMIRFYFFIECIKKMFLLKRKKK